MAKHEEMTRHAFISHMQAYMKKLLTDPLKADTDEFLKLHGIDGPKAIKILTYRRDPEDENSAVVIKSAAIKDNGTDENGNRLKDSFTVKYKIPRKDYTKKMRNLYISLFENNEIEGCPINEDGCGATAAAACNDSAPIVPLGRKTSMTPQQEGTDVIRRKTIYITQEQVDFIKNAINEEEGNCPEQTRIGGFGYAAPIGDGKNNSGNDFYKEANDHKDMMRKSWRGSMEEEKKSSIHIKEKNKGKFNATKARTGKSTEELTHSKNPVTRKRAIFAQNAAKWRKK